VRRRRRREQSAAEAELASYAALYAAAAEAGDRSAAERLRAVESWRGMLRAAGGDPEVGWLFAEFARGDWALHLAGVP
jgi:hypothetical protein